MVLCLALAPDVQQVAAGGGRRPTRNVPSPRLPRTRAVLLRHLNAPGRSLDCAHHRDGGESRRAQQVPSDVLVVREGGLRPAARRRERRRRWSIEVPGHIDCMELTPLRNQAGAVGAVMTRPNDEVAPLPAGGGPARLDGAAYGATGSALGDAVPAAGSGYMGSGGSSTGGPGSASTVREAAPARGSGEDRVS